MKHRTLNLQLPLGWYEVEGAQTPTFRRHGQKSGVLQLTMLPPVELADGEQALAYLHEWIAGLGRSPGSPVSSGHEECAEGILAFATYKHAHDGQLEFWLIPAEATVFAEWRMGSISTAGLERAQAHEILRTMRFEDYESDEPAADESGG